MSWSISTETAITSRSRNTTAANGSAIAISDDDLPSGEAVALVLLLWPKNVLNSAEAAARSVLPYFADGYCPASQSRNSPATSTRNARPNQKKAETATQPLERPNLSQSLPDYGCQRGRETKIIEAVNWPGTIEGQA